MPHRDRDGDVEFDRLGNQVPTAASGELLRQVAAQINAQQQRRELRLRQAGATAGLGGGEIERLIGEAEESRQGQLMQVVLAANIRRTEQQEQNQREQRARFQAMRERRRREGLAREAETRQRILGGIGTAVTAAAGPAGFALGGGTQALRTFRTLIGLQARRGGFDFSPEEAEALGLDPALIRRQEEPELVLDPEEFEPEPERDFGFLAPEFVRSLGIGRR